MNELEREEYRKLTEAINAAALERGRWVAKTFPEGKRVCWPGQKYMQRGTVVRTIGTSVRLRNDKGGRVINQHVTKLRPIEEAERHGNA